MKQTTPARQTQESPAGNSYVVTPHDTNPIGEFLPRGLYVGSGGDIVMVLDGDTAPVTFRNVPAGAILPVKVRRVLATGTGASDLVALY